MDKIEKELSESLQWYENVAINLLNGTSNKAEERYNTIMKNHFNSPSIKDAITAAGGNFLLNLAKTTATSSATVATTAGTAIGISGPTVAALPGPVAGASTACPAAIPIVLTAVGGLMFGKGIGEIGVTLWDRLIVGKGELEDLEEDIKKLKKYCDNMTTALSTTVKDLSGVETKLSKAKDKLKNQEYKTKESNVDSIQARYDEIGKIITNTDRLINEIANIKANLSKIG